MSISKDIDNIINVHTTTLWFLTKYVNEVGNHAKGYRFDSDSLNVPLRRELSTWKPDISGQPITIHFFYFF